MSEIITCPAGLTGPRPRHEGPRGAGPGRSAAGEVRRPGGRAARRLLEETLDAGPYDFGDKPIDWGLVLQGDRFYALLQIRASPTGRRKRSPSTAREGDFGPYAGALEATAWRLPPRLRRVARASSCADARHTARMGRDLLPSTSSASNAARCRPPPVAHERHRPEETVLHQVLSAHWAEFRERAEETGGLPRFVTDEVEAYLRCGRPEYGLLLCRCQQCGHEKIVALSCKRRSCPSCAGRTMTDGALDLVERVLPLGVPVRQWVCSLPWQLRALCGYDASLCADVCRIFTGEVSRSLRRRAKKELGLSSVADAHTGAVAFVQRFDSALR